MVNLPFWATLSEEARSAYLIAEYMMANPGITIGRAAFQLSKGTWDAARLARGLANVTKAIEAVGATGGDFAAIEQVVQHGTEAAAAADAAATAAAAAGQGVVRRVLTSAGRAILRRVFGKVVVEGSALALGTGVLATTVVLGTAVYLGANFLGAHSGDSSVQPGQRMKQPVSTVVTGPAPNGTDKVAVFLLPNNSGGTIWIGNESALKKLRGCDTPNGGTCDDPNKTYPMVTYVKESADFDTSAQAVADLCKAGKLESGYWGQKIAAYGGHYWYEGSCP
ncbi:MAG: hypothetical protein NVSMB27_30750 [Ktedonobacteraceae bacterium]